MVGNILGTEIDTKVPKFLRNFFHNFKFQTDIVQLGCDSLSAVRLQAQLKDKFQVEIPVEVLYQENFTVSELANLVNDNKVKGVNSIDWNREIELDESVS